jgi:hypothetical protein
MAARHGGLVWSPAHILAVPLLPHPSRGPVVLACLLDWPHACIAYLPRPLGIYAASATANVGAGARVPRELCSPGDGWTRTLLHPALRTPRSHATLLPAVARPTRQRGSDGRSGLIFFLFWYRRIGTVGFARSSVEETPRGLDFCGARRRRPLAFPRCDAPLPSLSAWVWSLGCFLFRTILEPASGHGLSWRSENQITQRHGLGLGSAILIHPAENP